MSSERERERSSRHVAQLLVVEQHATITFHFVTLQYLRGMNYCVWNTNCLGWALTWAAFLFLRSSGTGRKQIEKNFSRPSSARVLSAGEKKKTTTTTIILKELRGIWFASITVATELPTFLFFLIFQLTEFQPTSDLVQPPANQLPTSRLWKNVL